jgi:hypothetical protein
MDALLTRPGLRIERTVAWGQASPPGLWYDQPEAEWVLVLAGAARLRFQDETGAVYSDPAIAGISHRTAATGSTGPTCGRDRMAGGVLPLRSASLRTGRKTGSGSENSPARRQKNPSISYLRAISLLAPAGKQQGKRRAAPTLPYWPATYDAIAAPRWQLLIGGGR